MSFISLPIGIFLFSNTIGSNIYTKKIFMYNLQLQKKNILVDIFLLILTIMLPFIYMCVCVFTPIKAYEFFSYKHKN